MTPNPTEGKLTEADNEMDCLPCVFCGGNEVVMVDRVKGLYSFSIRCDNMQCVAEGPQAHTRKDAVKAWNTRIESLKAPSKAVCNECGGSKEVLRKNRVYGPLTTPCPSCTVKAPAVTTGEDLRRIRVEAVMRFIMTDFVSMPEEAKKDADHFVDVRKWDNTLSAPAPLSSEAVGKVRDALDDAELMENLACLEHERWADWMDHLFSKCDEVSGTMIIPQWAVDRWQNQSATAYGNLTEEEKESDRREVRRYLPIIKQALLTPSPREKEKP